VIELVVAADFAAAGTELFVAAAPRTVALAGGETPARVYTRLAALNYPWEKTEIFFGDERCVAPDDVASNYRMAWETLLSKVPAIVHPMPGETCDAAAYEREIEATFGLGVPSFDLIFLGLGAEGHTASLFPGDPALDERERLVVRVARPDHTRLTVTLPVLSAAKLVVFLVAGVAKRDALTRLLRGDDIPAARVHAERIVVIADAAAAPSPAAGAFR
jgi:6-phosphogluconolactonase